MIIQNIKETPLRMQKSQQETPALYTSSMIEEVKAKIEDTTGAYLDRLSQDDSEIELRCANEQQYECGFKYLFRKKSEEGQPEEYLLMTEFITHHPECLKIMSPLTTKDNILMSPSFKRYKPERDPSQHNLEDDGQLSKKLIFQTEPMKGQEIADIEQDMVLENYFLKSKHSKKLYTQDEISTLKKQLEFQSRGLISKATEFHQELSYIVKISFKCKYEGNSCPYLSILTYNFERNQKNMKLYKLQKINTQHLESCLLDNEEIHYNAITRKIDENLEVIVDIISNNSLDIKPKRVLELFSLRLGEESTDFIYHGISSKINKRAVKKYFDNSVAKARNMIKSV